MFLIQKRQFTKIYPVFRKMLFTKTICNKTMYKIFMFQRFKALMLAKFVSIENKIIINLTLLCKLKNIISTTI